MNQSDCMKLKIVRSCLVLLFAALDTSADGALVTAKEQYIVQDVNENGPVSTSYNGTIYAGFIPNTLLSNLNATSHSKEEFRFWLFEPETVDHNDSLAVILGGSSNIENCFFGDESDTLLRHPYNEAVSKTKMCWWTKGTRMLFVERMKSRGRLNMYENPESDDYSIFLQNFFTIFDNLRETEIILVGGGYNDPLVYSAYSIMRLKEATTGFPKITGVAFPYIRGGLQGMIQSLRWYGIINLSDANKLHNTVDNCAVVGPADRFENSIWIKDECTVGNVVVISAHDKPAPFGTNYINDVTTSFESVVGTISSNGPMFERLRTLLTNPEVKETRNGHPKWKNPNFALLWWG